MRTSFLTPVRKMDIGLLRQMLNNENITADEKVSAQKQVQELPEIFRLLASLEDDTQKLLLSNWARSELVLNEEIVGQLLDYLSDSPAENNSEKLAVIKAFAFLELNNLPKTKQLVDALRSVFSQEKNLSQSLIEILNNEDLSRNIKTILTAELGLDLDQKNKIDSAANNADEFNTAEEIKNYLNKSKFITSLLDLDKESSEKINKVLDHLLGQKLINIELQEDNSLFMLALEIPLKFKKENKLLPLFLKIAEEEDSENNSAAEKEVKSYAVTLITEFPQLGTIKSSIQLQGNILNTQFFSDSEAARQLIENNLQRLKTILEEQGFKVESFNIAEFADSSAEKANFFNQLFLSEFDLDDKLKEKYSHLDIRV